MLYLYLALTIFSKIVEHVKINFVSLLAILFCYFVAGALIEEIICKRPKKFNADERSDSDILIQEYWNNPLFKLVQIVYVGVVFVAVLRSYTYVRNHNEIQREIMLKFLPILILVLLALELVMFILTYITIDKNIVNCIRNTITFQVHCTNNVMVLLMCTIGIYITILFTLVIIVILFHQIMMWFRPHH